MNTKERTKDQERKSEMRKHTVAHHEKESQSFDENQGQEENMDIQEKGNYGHKTQDQMHQESEASSTDTTNKKQGTAEKQHQASAQRKPESMGFGQPFQYQRNPGQRKPSEGDFDPTE